MDKEREGERERGWDQGIALVLHFVFLPESFDFSLVPSNDLTVPSPSFRPSLPPSLPPSLLLSDDVAIDIISSTFPDRLSVGIANDVKLTKDDFEERYVQEVKETPSQEEIELYYQLYLAKHVEEGTFMSWIMHARNREEDGKETDGASVYVLG